MDTDGGVMHGGELARPHLCITPRTRPPVLILNQDATLLAKHSFRRLSLFAHWSRITYHFVTPYDFAARRPAGAVHGETARRACETRRAYLSITICDARLSTFDRFGLV